MLTDSIQQLSLKFRYKAGNQEIMIPFVYARCNVLDILELWKDIEHVLYANQIPWIIGGYFSGILHDEKLLGLPFTQHEATHFAQCINNCAISESKFYKG